MVQVMRYLNVPWQKLVVLPNLFDHETELSWRNQLEIDPLLRQFLPFLGLD